MDSSSSDEPIKYAPNRLGIALIAAGLIGLVLSVYAIYAMGHWQGIWVYIAIYAFFFHQHCLCAFCAKPYFGSNAIRADVTGDGRPDLISVAISRVGLDGQPRNAGGSIGKYKSNGGLFIVPNEFLPKP